MAAAGDKTNLLAILFFRNFQTGLFRHYPHLILRIIAQWEQKMSELFLRQSV